MSANSDLWKVDLSQNFIKSHNYEQKLEKMDQETRPLRVKVARLDDEYLANLRKMSTGNVLENVSWNFIEIIIV